MYFALSEIKFAKHGKSTLALRGLLSHRHRCLLMADSVEKVGVSAWPNFFSAVGAVFTCGRGGLIIYIRLNGASSKSICGGSYRQSKMSFVFWQI